MNCIDQNLMELNEFMKGKDESELIEVLHKTQDLYGYIPKDIATKIAVNLNIPLSKIYGVATFYSRFSLTPKGKYAISVCMGTACYVKGAESILDEFSKILKIGVGETTEDLNFSIVETRCVGNCAFAPVVTVNDKVYKNVEVSQVKGIIDEILGGTFDE